MRKVVIPRAGSYDQLHIATHSDPEPAAGEVVVEAAAVGVNFADCVVRMGLYESAKTYVGWPITPGFECAGKISKIGAGIDDLKVGDTVVALTRFGAYATQVKVPRRQVFGIPRTLDLHQAGGFFVAHLTAWYALRELCRLRPGMRLLVHSAAGGVGGALVQVGKLCGCIVVGVVGAPHKIEAARAMGADHVIVKNADNLWAEAVRFAPDGYDVVLDANGVETLRPSYRHLAPTGRLVVYGFHTMLERGAGKPNWLKLAADFVRTPRFSPIDMTNRNKSVMGFNLSYLFDKLELLDEAMTELLSWVDAGRLRAPQVTPIPFERVAEAHRALESGTTVGKLVLVP